MKAAFLWAVAARVSINNSHPFTSFFSRTFAPLTGSGLRLVDAPTGLTPADLPYRVSRIQEPERVASAGEPSHAGRFEVYPMQRLQCGDRLSHSG